MRYHAARGGGAWRGAPRLAVSGVASLADAFIGHSPVEEWMRAGDGGQLAAGRRGARAGTRGLSDAWAHLLVAQGSMEALVEHEPCLRLGLVGNPGHRRGGGRTYHHVGRAPTPAPGSNLLVSNGLVHDEVVAVLAKGGT